MRDLDGASLVYFVEAKVRNRLVQISSTKTFSSRFAQLTRDNAVPLRILGLELRDDAKEHEAVLHKLFATDHAHAAWFRRSPTISAYVKEATTQPRRVVVPAPNVDDINTLLDQEVPDALLTPRQLADTLGVSLATIRRHVTLRTVPFIRVGGQVRFDPTSVVEWSQLRVRSSK